MQFTILLDLLMIWGGGILLPSYACESILNIVKKCNLNYYFYDIDEEDLNADLSSIIALHRKTKAKYLLVASMYGNPANLMEIEQYCRKVGLILIDDAAQSFGATLEDRYVGTFGDAGFLSFSPGKPTAGHMGAFYWTNASSYSFKTTHHPVIHRLIYWNFYFNRLKIYKYKKYHIFSILNLPVRFIYKCINISNDSCCKFEYPVLGGIINDLLNGKFSFRREYSEKFASKFIINPCFDIIKSSRGIPYVHKLVIKAKTVLIADQLIKYLGKKHIYCSNGYALLTHDMSMLPHASNINNRIVELPIEDDTDKMDYLFKKVEQFITEYDRH
ncbi:hypothetical protein FACS1894110_19640 [Spirochaetia bacterium]|nr:hypothetical protein FACS1894110_19640 [Spirochaetia bacterium]